MNVAEEYLRSKGAFKQELPESIDMILKSVPKEVPRTLALAITLSEVGSFVSAYRNNILLNTPSSKLKTLVPTNLFIFGLAPSGISKDRTKNDIRKLLAGGYEGLDSRILADLKVDAKAKAIADGDEEANYYSYMEEPINQEFPFGTLQGVSATISDIGNKQSLGCPYLFSGEIGSDLSTRGDEVVKTFTLMSELYDLGNGKFDTVRTKELKIPEVKTLPVNFLVFGSEKGILMDRSIKDKFSKGFNQQLARRCLFTFTQYLPAIVRPSTAKEILADAKATVKSLGLYHDVIYEEFEDLGICMPSNTEIFVSTGTDDIFTMYKIYNEGLAEEISDTLPISKLARKHKQWVALKLSGIYAMLDKSTTIEPTHYTMAINTVEILSNDLSKFEEELDKEAYEQLDSYCNIHARDGEFTLTIHELKKLKFISGNGAEGKLRELLMLLNDYSKKGIYEIDGSKLIFKEIIDTEQVGVSILPVSTLAITTAIEEGKPKSVVGGLKQKLAFSTVYGYEFFDTPFSEYTELLNNDFAYTPFKLKDVSTATYDKEKHPKAIGGIRGRDNIDSGAKFVVLDIDTSDITDKEAHTMLEEINHHIARTSDRNNGFKFRVLIEMDMVVVLDGVAWKHFITLVGEELGLLIDIVPQSQIFYSYKDRDVLSVTEAKPMAVKDLVVKAIELMTNTITPKTLTKVQVKAKLDNPMETFSRAFNLTQDRNTHLIGAARKAQHLGADTAYIVELMHKINRYIDDPLPEDELERNLLTQIRRW